MTDFRETLRGLFAKVDGARAETPSAGSRYRLMGLVADITEVAETLQREVLTVVSQEAVLDADADIDYGEEAERVMTMELEPRADHDEAMCENITLANEALGALSDILSRIADQLLRHHKDEEYARLYESEKRRYMNSGTSKRSRQAFEEWKDLECYGHPLQEQIEDYRMEKLLHMFEKGVMASRVEHIQRAKRYPNEVDFDQLDDDHPLKTTVHKHYAALRKIVDYEDGRLVVDPVRVGRHFYACRREPNAKTHRTNFLKYMHKIDLVQQEAARKPEADEEQLNFVAPSINLKKLLEQEWFSVLTTDEKRFDSKWTTQFIEALMHSEWGEQIARDWAQKDKRMTLRCIIVGLLKDEGVLRGSYNQIAKLLDFDGENAATLAKYMGLGKKQPFADWVHEYVNS